MNSTDRLEVSARLWRWTGAGPAASWHFLTIAGPAAESLCATALMRRLEGMGRGFGSLRVRAAIGDTRCNRPA